MYDCLNALMTFPSTYKDLMEDALSLVKWKKRGEATPRAKREKTEGQEVKASSGEVK